MNNHYQELLTKLGKGRVKINELLSKHTTYKIGGPADLYIEIETETELVKVISLVKKIKIPFFILGTGSNVLASDKGFRGIIIKLSNCELRFENGTVTAGAGLPIPVLINKCRENSLTGLEFMAGIPGTVGGAVRGNAGAWQENIGDFISRVKILSSSGEVIWIDKDNCSFEYRDSRFKHNEEIILAVEFNLEKKDNKKIREKIMFYINKRLGQPKEPSAGCVFVNPKPQSAGELIDKSGLKNSQCGNAKISEKHANFIINLGGAKAVEVEKLINLAKKEVKDQFGVELKEEIIKIGEF